MYFGIFRKTRKMFFSDFQKSENLRKSCFDPKKSHFQMFLQKVVFGFFEARIPFFRILENPLWKPLYLGIYLDFLENPENVFSDFQKSGNLRKSCFDPKITFPNVFAKSGFRTF